MKTYTAIVLATAIWLLAACGGKPAIVKLTTTEGDITVKLYDSTPKHRDNFLKLAEEGFYDSLLFHRVINEFMIQAGDPDSKNAPAGKKLGNGGPGYRLEAEIMPKTYFHKKGALAAARENDRNNVERKSSGSQFYIVQGRTFNDKELKKLQNRIRQRDIRWRVLRIMENSPGFNRRLDSLRKAGDKQGIKALRQEVNQLAQKRYEKSGAYSFTQEQRKTYKEIGGAPHLDGAYTVFGEVVNGLEVVDKIAKTETDGANRPEKDVRILDVEILNR